MRSIEAKNLARGLALTGAVILTPSLLGCEGPKPQPTIPALGPAESAFRCANGEFTLDKTNLKGDRAVILDAIADSGINISQNEINLWKDCYNAG